MAHIGEITSGSRTTGKRAPTTACGKASFSHSLLFGGNIRPSAAEAAPRFLVCHAATARAGQAQGRSYALR